MTDEQLKLSPCPFCGGEAKLNLGEHNFDSAQIGCLSCAASGPVFDDDPQIGGQGVQPIPDAIKAWNTRAVTRPAPTEALLKAVDHTLCVHGHIDAGTPLHDRIVAALASMPGEAVSPTKPEAARKVLGPFYKTVDVMKSARNQPEHNMCIWADDMKAVEDVMTFLETIRDAALPSEAIGREWQDISTAPKDGEAILLYKPDQPRSGNYIVSGYWGEWASQEGSGEYWIACAGGPLTPPTHWMPLPAGPSVTRPNRGDAA